MAVLMALFLPSTWDAGILLLITCPSCKDQFKHTYTERSLQTRSLCLPPTRAPYSLLCTGSKFCTPVVIPMQETLCYLLDALVRIILFISWAFWARHHTWRGHELSGKELGIKFYVLIT